MLITPALIGIAIFYKGLEQNSRRMELEMEEKKLRVPSRRTTGSYLALFKSDTFTQEHGKMLMALSSLGCQSTANEDGTIDVEYQGEKFHIEFNGYFAQIWDFSWASVDRDDSGFSNLQEAANVGNYNYGPTVVLSHPDEQNRVFLHSRSTIVLHPSFPDIEDYIDYIYAILRSFFSIKKEVLGRCQQISSLQILSHENRRPVGFETSVE